MDKRTFVGLCAALAFVAGSPGAYALKIFTTQQSLAAVVMAAEAATNGSFTYAAETLLMGTDNVTPASDDSDMATYYNIGGGDVHLAAPVGVAATEGDTYVVSFRLNGMVFQEMVVDADLDGGDFELATGGRSGDKLAVFRLTAEGVATTVALNLQASFAISGNAGTVTMTIRNQTLAVLEIEGVTGTEVHTGTVIKVAPALDEEAIAMNATADVAASFKKFLAATVDGMSVAPLGSLEVGFETHRSASTGTAISAIGEIIVTEDDDGDDPPSTVTFMGDFSFASKVFTHAEADCGVELGTTGAGLLMRDDMDMVSDTTMTTAVNVTVFTDAQYLCIMVQGEDDESEDGMDAPRIPATGAYTAMGSYTGIGDAAIGPKPQEQTLGMIMRNGTTVYFPFLTSQLRYNQVLRITNRGSNPARYEFSSSEMDEPMEDTLMGGGMTTRLLVRDLIGDGVGEASGTLIIEAQPGNIDVALVHVNRDDSSTDTWIYESE
jgi:hypothetical protein